MDAAFITVGIVPNFLVVCNLGIIFAPSKFDVNRIFRALILNMLRFKISFLLFFNLSPKCNES